MRGRRGMTHHAFTKHSEDLSALFVGELVHGNTLMYSVLFLIIHAFYIIAGYYLLLFVMYVKSNNH
jgi:hypothetical protein